MKRKLFVRALLDKVWPAVMLLCLLGAGFVLSSILIAITSRGLRSLSWEMISTPPQRAFYLGGA
ncbi:MAG: hypothetical protein MUQ30_05280, partial [Anaerolineae bacterium]|nr:hypothetical protein [Anaerolineae bacterium]